MPWGDGTRDLRSATRNKQPTSILLAEDDAEMRNLLALTLAADGYRVYEVADGKQLVEWLARHFDCGSLEEACQLIIADVRMPGYSGLDVLSSLSCVGCRLPVIIVTAFGDRATHARARTLGAAAVLDKPFDLDELRLIVARLLPESQALD